MAIREQTETRFYTSDGRAFTDRHEALEAELVEQLSKVLCTEVRASRHGHYNNALAGMKVFDANELARRIALRARAIGALLDEHLRSTTTLGMSAMSCSGPGTHQDNIVRVGDRWCYDYPCHNPSESGVSTRTLVVKNVRKDDPYVDMQAEEEGSLLKIRGLQLDKTGCPANLRKREGEMYKWYRAPA